MNKKFVSRLIRDIVPSSSPLVSLPQKTQRNGRLYSRISSRHSRESGNPESPLVIPVTPPFCHSRESGNPEPSSNCANYTVPRIASSKGFTLLEVMVVTTILATLATTTLVTLNPVELLAQMRDSQRITTIGMLRDAVSLLVADRPATSLAVTNLVHISLPSIHQNCADIVGLPALPTNQTYRCVPAAFLTNIDGTGWIPLDFRGITDGSPFTHLPVDPINTSTSFYSFTTAPGQRATIAARIESIRQRTIHPPGADGISVFATHFTAAVDRPPLGIGQVAVPLGSTASPSYTFVGDLNTGIFSPLADNIGFSTLGAERMRIDDIGRVGIGTSAPGERLTVAGVIHSTIGGIRFPDGTLQATAGGATGPGGALPTGTASQTLRHSGTAWVADSNIFNTGTNVGIGTTNPTEKLAVEAANAKLRVRAVGNAGTSAIETMRLVIGTNTDGNFPNTAGNRLTFASRWMDTTEFTTAAIESRHNIFWGGGLVFLTKPSDGNSAGEMLTRMVINQNGNVGIGTTAPGARLEVAGNIIAAPPTASNHVATRGWVEALTGPAFAPLIVNSAGVANVSITGTHPGMTNYLTHPITLGTVVSLTAPLSASGIAFQNWFGCDSVTGTTTCNLTMNTARTVTVSYLPTLTVNSPVIGIAITSTTGHGGTTNYSRTLSPGTVVALTAPSTAGGHIFLSWQGCDSVSGTTCNLTLNTVRTVSVLFGTVFANHNLNLSCASICTTNGFSCFSVGTDHSAFNGLATFGRFFSGGSLCNSSSSWGGAWTCGDVTTWRTCGPGWNDEGWTRATRCLCR